MEGGVGKWKVFGREVGEREVVSRPKTQISIEFRLSCRECNFSSFVRLCQLDMFGLMTNASHSLSLSALDTFGG